MVSCFPLDSFGELDLARLPPDSGGCAGRTGPNCMYHEVTEREPALTPLRRFIPSRYSGLRRPPKIVLSRRHLLLRSG